MEAKEGFSVHEDAGAGEGFGCRVPSLRYRFGPGERGLKHLLTVRISWHAHEKIKTGRGCQAPTGSQWQPFGCGTCFEVVRFLTPGDKLKMSYPVRAVKSFARLRLLVLVRLTLLLPLRSKPLQTERERRQRQLPMLPLHSALPRSASCTAPGQLPARRGQLLGAAL